MNFLEKGDKISYTVGSTEGLCSLYSIGKLGKTKYLKTSVICQSFFIYHCNKKLQISVVTGIIKRASVTFVRFMVFYFTRTMLSTTVLWQWLTFHFLNAKKLDLYSILRKQHSTFSLRNLVSVSSGKKQESHKKHFKKNFNVFE